MNDPHIYDRKPAVIELEAGTYFWCRCGLSKKQPYCDGAHKGTAFSPVKLVLTEKQRVALCNCKHTQNPPFCDGSHSRIGSIPGRLA